MNSGFIAALLVMVIMTAFTFIILRMIAVNTGNKIRDNVIIQIKSYDVLIQKKEAELQAINKQIENEKIKVTDDTPEHLQYQQTPSGVFVIADVEYRSNDFGQDYRKLKEKFSFDRSEIIRNIYNQSIEQKQQDTSLLLDSLLDKISLDNVYKLTALTSAEQLEIIREIITKEERNILVDYVNQNEYFHCQAFYQWLYMQKKINDKQIVIRTAEINENYNNLGENINTEYDKNLCEGFQILIGNKMYDYGVRRRELI